MVSRVKVQNELARHYRKSALWMILIIILMMVVKQSKNSDIEYDYLNKYKKPFFNSHFFAPLKNYSIDALRLRPFSIRAIKNSIVFYWKEETTLIDSNKLAVVRCDLKSEFLP